MDPDEQHEDFADPHSGDVVLVCPCGHSWSTVYWARGNGAGAFADPECDMCGELGEEE